MVETMANSGGYTPPNVLTLSFMGGGNSQYYHSLGLDSAYETPVCKALGLYTPSSHAYEAWLGQFTASIKH